MRASNVNAELGLGVAVDAALHHGVIAVSPRFVGDEQLAWAGKGRSR